MKKAIASKLLNYSRKNSLVHQQTLLRYFQERFLYRLSISDFKKNFLLKGGALVYSLSEEVGSSRPTLDVDLLAKRIEVNIVNIEKTFSQICEVECNDGVVFEIEKMVLSTITKDGDYQGTRIKMPCKLGNIKDTLQIDIGVGDIVTPAPVEMEYPNILEEFEAPKLWAYSIETMIAEKFQAMISLGEHNSRMKDFYDLYTFLGIDEKYNKDILKTAIKNTFHKRNTSFSDNHILFQDSFYQNERRLIQWKAFLRKSYLDQSIEFSDVMKVIKDKLLPIYDSLKN